MKIKLVHNEIFTFENSTMLKIMSIHFIGGISSNLWSPNQFYGNMSPYSNALLCLFSVKIFVSSQIRALQAAKRGMSSNDK